MKEFKWHEMKWDEMKWSEMKRNEMKMNKEIKMQIKTNENEMKIKMKIKMKMTWNEMKWNERMNEWIEMNELRWMTWCEWLAKSGPKTSVFFYVFYVKLSYRYSLVHLLPASSSKSAPRLTVFLRFLCKIVHMLSTTFPDRAAKPWRQRPSFGDHGSHFTRKNTGFCAQECFQAWIHALPISHTSQLLAWWCGWHDDWGDDVVAIMVRKLAMTIVCNSEVS